MVCFMQVLHNFEVCSGDPVEDIYLFDVPIMTNCWSLKNLLSNLICSFFLC